MENMPAVQISPIAHIRKVWERIAPLQLAERTWDNVGVMVDLRGALSGSQSQAGLVDHRVMSQRGAVTDKSLTTAVCNEALSLPSCSVIVSYHPPIFRGLKSLTLQDPLQSSLLKLSAKGISVFSPHTSLDSTPNGINSFLAGPFLNKGGSAEVITPSEQLPGFEGAGMGKLLKLGSKLSIAEVVAMVKAHLDIKFVQLATPEHRPSIESIAICAGSGGSLLKDVKADLLLTGEMSHHEVLAAVARGQSVILCNHSNTERPYLFKVLQPWLEAELNKESSGWQVLVSKADRDPLETV